MSENVPEMICFDCKANTFYMEDAAAYLGSEDNDTPLFRSEYYMVKNEIWQESGINKETPLPSGLFLCISCLEERLGRALRGKDLLDVPINFPSPRDTILLWMIKNEFVEELEKEDNKKYKKLEKIAF